jgi:hypothetical protein
MLAIYLTKLFFSDVFNKQSKALFCSLGSLTFFNLVVIEKRISMMFNDFLDFHLVLNLLEDGFCHDF